MLNEVSKRFLSCLIPSSHGLLHNLGIATIALVGVLIQDEIYADSPLIDERCESYELSAAINLPIRHRCWAEKDACIDERMTSLNESLEQAEKFCWKQPLSIDPRYVGPCPSYLEELETDAYDGARWVLPRINLRNRFEQPHPQGAASSDWYKRKESVQILRSFLGQDPNNFVALRYLKTRLDREAVVEKLTLEIKLHAFDPDCPNNRWLRQGLIFSYVNQLADNWLMEHGVGSELSKNERRELLQRARFTLLDMYDIAIEQDSGTDRLYWALESIHDAVLSGMLENLQRIYDRHQIEYQDYFEERRKKIVHDLSNEYGVNSVHGRTKTLSMMCNGYAFELGLDDHCLNLLEHYGKEDANSLSTDWAQGAILLVNWMTRDCAENALLSSLGAPIWWIDRRCATDGVETSIRSIGSLLSRFSRDEPTAEHNLLSAYLSLNETSDDYFIRALKLDKSLLTYGARLSKRLLKRGHHEAASNVMSRIQEEDQSDLITGEKRLIDQTSESVNDGTYSNWIEMHRYAFTSDEE